MALEAARRRPRRDWAAILSDQAASGQTAGIYCRERGIPYKSYLYHRQKARAVAGAVGSCGLQSAPASAFVPVRVSASASGAVVRIVPGIAVECEHLPDATWIAELALRLMREARC